MWEYQRQELKISTILQLNEELHKLGNNNWEIIFYNEEKPIKFGATFSVIVLAKRKKE